MKNPNRLLIAFLGILGVIVVYLLVEPLLHSPQSINFTSKLEEFQKSGVPDFTLPVFDSKLISDGKFNFDAAQKFQLSQVAPSIIVVNFWASWCEPCLDEFPSLVQLSKKYEKDPRLKIVAVAMDEDLSALKTFMTTGLQPSPKNFITVLDPAGKVASQFGTKKIPETYILDKSRKLVRKVLDKQNWMSPDFLKFLEGLLQSPG